MKQRLPWKWLIAGGCALAFVSVAVGVSVGVMDNRFVCRGVQVSGVDVGGLTPAQAQERLQAALSERLNKPVILTHNSLRWSVTPSKIAMAFDFKGTVERAHRVGKEGSWLQQLRARIDLLRHPQDVPPLLAMNAKTPERFRALHSKVNRPPVNAEAVLQGATVRLIAERPGVELDTEETARRVLSAVANERPTATVELALKTTQPKVTTGDLTSVNAVLAAYTTRFNPGKRNRTHNLGIASRALDKLFVPVGGTFSYNSTVGPREARFGYKPAPIFADNEIVQGVGGGVCQVATTVYNAALLAGQEITARTPHSRPVDYAPRGRDATVFFGQQDLKFRNPLPHPVYLRTKLAGNKLTVWVLGNAADKRGVEILATKDARIPAGVVRISDPTLPSGKEVVVKRGRSGYRTTLVRLITSSQGKKSETFSNYYPPQNTVIRVGSAPQMETATEVKSKVPIEGNVAG